jgi:hypothetical protein
MVISFRTSDFTNSRIYGTKVRKELQEEKSYVANLNENKMVGVSTWH